jgi:hypothetical protein
MLGRNFGTLATLALFPLHSSREEYLASTGKEAPPYNPSRPVQGWEDPNPPAADPEGNIKYLTLYMASDHQTPKVDSNGNPMLVYQTIPRDQALHVNVADKGDATGVHGTVDTSNGEVMVPMRPLAADEVWAWQIGGAPLVMKKVATPPAPAAGTPANLASIEAKLQLLDDKLSLLISMSAKGVQP